MIKMDNLFEVVNFNSRPCVRGDLPPGHNPAASCISIHAPARGATPRNYAKRRVLYDFNSRPCERGDLALPTSATLSGFAFQFTPLREGRRGRLGDPAAPQLFQFTPLREGRRNIAENQNRSQNFNSRPCERGDSFGHETCEHQNPFQFTPLREGRPLRRSGIRQKGIFQFTPLREGRHPCPWRCGPITINFNSRPCERGDQGRHQYHPGPTNFNSRPCERGDKISGLF